jgi:CelD/BcsL family acetyltransferase involved in cellulose biosynthesis
MTGLGRTPSTPRLEVVTVDPTTDTRWWSLLDADAAGLFHSPPWLRAVSEAYSLPIEALVALDRQGTPLGGIAFCTLSDMLGRRVICAPFCDTCDPLLRSPGVWSTLFDELQQHELPVSLRTLGDSPTQADTRLETTKRARWHTIDDIADLEAARVKFEGPARRGIRKAEQAGVVVRPLEDADGLAQFHRLHIALRKSKYRLLAQPLRFFESIRSRFEDVGGWFPLGAFVDGKLVAATVYLRWRDTLYYKFNASRLDSLALRPNNLLVSAGISLAYSLGCGKLDLGPSDDDQPGLIRFKRQFGASERELRFLRYAPPGWQDPSRHGNDLRRLLGEFSRIFTAPQVPDELAGRAGALLYRFFA